MGIYLNGKMVSTAIPLSSGNIDSSLIDSKITAHNSDPNAHSAMLKTAINNALAQAKESGEFKGDKGDTGPQGPQGPSGVAGTRGSTWSISNGGAPSMNGSELKGDMLLDKSNGDVYTANVETMDWEKVMNIKGPKGDKGDGGTGTIVIDSSLSSTSTNPVQNKVINAALAEKLPITGGTLTGNLTGKYLTGTWLQTTAVTEANSTSKVAVIDNSGWIYYRTLEHFKTDLSVPTKTSQLTNDSGFLTSHQNLSGYAKETWVTQQIQTAIDATWEASY